MTVATMYGPVQEKCGGGAVPRTKTTRAGWVDAGLRVLADRGIDAVRIELLARELDVTKGGFYGHFADRGAFLDELLDTWEHEVIDEVVQRVEASADVDPRDRLRTLIGAISDPVTPATGVDTELAIRDWARRDGRAAAVLERVDGVRTGCLREIFRGFCSPEEAEARTVIAVSVRLAGEVMSFGHGPYGSAEAVDLVIARLLV